MGDQRATIVVDLGFGDAGKGSVVDYLTRSQFASTVIRFNGGAQAAHNVALPDGRHHAFAQFGAGSFVPGVQTLLSRFFLLDPYALFNEEAHLRALGVTEPFTRLIIDRRALVITPYHQAANRLRERVRGAARHGSCGMGIGETVADSLTTPELALYAGDLPDMKRVQRRLEQVREAKHAELQALLNTAHDLPGAAAELAVFTDDTIPEIAAENYAYLSDQVKVADENVIKALIHTGNLIFEGAQGVLIDQTHGFAPFTTWSDTTFRNAETILTENAFSGATKRLGVLRSYAVRHGPGPFVTEDANLSAALPEAHNGLGPWQGAFRVGWFDLVAARYALEVCGGVDGLALTHLDRLPSLPASRLCSAYRYRGHTDDLDHFFERTTHSLIRAIRFRPSPTLEHQHALTEQLLRCEPIFEPILSDQIDFVESVTSALNVSAVLLSTGPGWKHKIPLRTWLETHR